MRTTLRRIFLTLFTASMAAFLLLALALVFGQALGLLIGQPGLITGAATALLQPSIIAAICAGLFGFGVFNTRGTADSEE